ncbi:sigma-70 family RNA polymerase sigma factor [Mucilaginibacter rubeus]|uniref:Sigma-70 family RNA polymerase sigma factor n=2 Tax=Sphingobacteriaceae TaxID=84566 RepID=A0AAE6MJW6_9SPHI|nr:sigma-70 family RNA polymerase sigma factor [Mucilaginibacter rubeus]QEM18632.1 sigma-70 family RNA polymerase sigma factor [Mucilaginibacter gossypii]QEM06051.1 sigma-70 family RNA polymerase sigma factor [Mucilaginibacter rubeus]QTE44826.1 sigma-70 family RNA polymerase sigma factor [Mucilaginibacter rubeus]QTE51424.1 sigma-70 family RNA polymerase sigma factor [Mucilaginibacter rubeus]QTE56510.1 sigma-70 family RNA polymerase sigma factor [Mucilaginibacter rubeus]
MSKKRKISMSEEELVLSLRHREKIAVEALYDMYSASLFGVISRIINDTAIAEDVLQETFVKIWHSFSSYSTEKGRLFTWMVNIARNLAIDKTRSKDFKNQNKNQDIENNVTFIDEQRNTVYKPELMGVKNLVQTLKPEQRLIIELVYFKGYTHVEAAEELGIPLGTIKTRLRMAILELRKHFN